MTDGYNGTMQPTIYRGHRWELHVGNCLDLLHDYDGEPFDSVIADPPYSSGGATRGDRTMSTLTKYVNTDSGHQERLPDFEGDNRDQRGFVFWCTLWLAAAWDCTKPGATAHIFCDWRQLPSMTDALTTIEVDHASHSTGGAQLKQILDHHSSSPVTR